VALPASLKTTPRLDRWIRFNPDLSVTVCSGKVELGQGIETAIAQVAAEELDVALERIRLVAGDTTRTPDEGYTTGSMSMEVGGASMRIVCAEVRGLFVEAAARLFEVSPAEVHVRDGTLEVPGTDLRTSYWNLAAHVDLARDVAGTTPPKPAAAYMCVGTSVPRRDLRAKLTGAAFVHDMELPGMVHGRVCRPPSYLARLKRFDAAAVRGMPGVVSVLVSGSFIGVTAEREEQAQRALAIARTVAEWEEREGSDLPASTEVREFLPALPSTRKVVHEKVAGAPPAAPVAGAVRTLQATYSKPYIAHASIGPSCALARFAGDRLTVWSHTQGSHMLRDQIARAMGIPGDRVDVIHADGAGCYGHNGADDAALDAALLARDCGRPVLLQWTRDDEFAWSPFGSAMVVRISATLDAGGTVVDWRHEIWSHTHVNRPGRTEGINLLGAWHIDPPHPVPPARDNTLPSGGGDRNAVPLYDFARQEVIYNFIAEMPLRVSALRSLGAYANVFAIESFIDELAAAAGADPVEFRLRHLQDERAREVVAAAAALARWQTWEVSDGTRGRGIGFARYKNLSAYLAVIVAIEVGRTIRVRKVFAAVDCGLVVNPDGVRNQIEGGIVQAISWTLKEAVTWDRERVTSRSWDSYPVLRFDEVPDIEITLLDRRDAPSLGVGECAAGPVGAALANALQHALGVRIRDLPLTPERIASLL
jgi:CO/xanthine dehydrogenase Mo-binding subunit